MASKTQKRRQKDKKKAIAVGSKDINVDSGAAVKKVNHCNGQRKNLKHKQKIRSGHQTSYDIYEEFAEKTANLKEGVACSTCHNLIRTKNYCVWCATNG